jgi:hypothetical protein
MKYLQDGSNCGQYDECSYLPVNSSLGRQAYKSNDSCLVRFLLYSILELVIVAPYLLTTSIFCYTVL